MARLIDADAILAEHCADCTEETRELCKYDALCGSMMWIEDAPTVDAVPVVRCKDCKFIHDKGFCTRVAGLTRIKLDDFCSYGEREDNG